MKQNVQCQQNNSEFYLACFVNFFHNEKRMLSLPTAILTNARFNIFISNKSFKL